MQLIGAGLGDHIYLATSLGAVFRIVQGAANAIFVDSVLGDLQARLRFLRLFLNTACVDPINLKVVVVARTPRETNGSLVATAVILSEGRQESETGPVAPIVREICDLASINDRRRFPGTAVRWAPRSLHLNFFRDSADFKTDIQRASLANSQDDVPDNLGLKSRTR